MSSERDRDDWPPERIKAERKRAGMTQRQLADALGVTAAAVGQWEVGANKITDLNRHKLARVLLDGELPSSVEARLNELDADMREIRAQVSVLRALVLELAANRPSHLSS